MNLYLLMGAEFVFQYFNQLDWCQFTVIMYVMYVQISHVFFKEDCIFEQIKNVFIIPYPQSTKLRPTRHALHFYVQY